MGGNNSKNRKRYLFEDDRITKTVHKTPIAITD